MNYFFSLLIFVLLLWKYYNYLLGCIWVWLKVIIYFFLVLLCIINVNVCLTKEIEYKVICFKD